MHLALIIIIRHGAGLNFQVFEIGDNRIEIAMSTDLSETNPLVEMFVWVPSTKYLS